MACVEGEEDIIYLMLLMGQDGTVVDVQVHTRGGNKRRVGLAGPVEATMTRPKEDVHRRYYFLFYFFYFALGSFFGEGEGGSRSMGGGVPRASVCTRICC